MNLVKANIIGGNAKGKVLWVDRDSALTSWNQGTFVTTYKTYGYYHLPKDKNDITTSDYHARIKTSFIEFIEEDRKVNPVDKNSMFKTLVTAYGDQPIFSVITSEDGEMMKGDITFEQCEDWIKNHQDYDDSDFEIVMKIVETKTIKQMTPTI